MKIMHVVSSLGSGGAENLVCNLAVEMSGRGHSVAVLYVSDAGRLGACEAYERDMRVRLERAGVQVVELGHFSRRNPIAGGARMRREIDRFSPDVVHAHLFFGLVFFGLALKWVPCVYTHHNIRFGFGRRLFPFFNMYVSRYIAICKATEAELRPLTKRPIDLVYNAISLEKSVPRPECLLPEKFSLISVGRLSPQKNYSLLIKAIAMLLERRPNLSGKVELRIAGEGDQRPEIEAIISAYNLGDVISLLGVRQDVSDLLAASDLFLMSSDYEGLPIALLEAIGAGLPVVVTDVGGNREIVEKTGAGRLVPAGDARALSLAVENLLDNESERMEFGRRGRAAIGQFGLGHAVEQHLALYSEAINRSPRPNKV